MRVLFVGDVVGRAGRKFLRKHLSGLKEKQAADLTVVNVENAAGGFGISPRLTEEILGLGVDVLTSGNHVWDRREILKHFQHQPRLLRPGNYPPGLPGRYVYTGETEAGQPYTVANLQGRIFMTPIDCPFRFFEERLAELRRTSPVMLIDFHAEATSEKMAMGWFLDGRVSAMVGTHTHVPTADLRILPKGTAYVTDVGMTGAFDSVIGMQTEGALSRLLTGVGKRFEPASENVWLSAVVIEVDDTTGKSLSIERCDIRPI
jgi:metallophosphoesterase (TIGR00282 family)